jgi:hypothetical protein
MFEVWERFDAKKAKSLMNRHRKALRREHASLRKLLRSKSNDPATHAISEQISSLRQAYRLALKDQIQLCPALTRGFFVINIAKILDAFLAQSRLFATCQEVAQTLHQNRSMPARRSKPSTEQPRHL